MENHTDITVCLFSGARYRQGGSLSEANRVLEDFTCFSTCSSLSNKIKHLKLPKYGGLSTVTSSVHL